MDSDPHGSGTLAWIRNFGLDPDPELDPDLELLF